MEYNDVEKADILLQQFSSVVIKESKGIPRTENRTNTAILDLHVTHVMELEELENLNVTKSCRPDEIHPRLMELPELIAGPVALTFNTAIRPGVLPIDWKRAFASPIYKKGSRNLAENYWPISLTSILCKMSESFGRDKIVKHLL